MWRHCWQVPLAVTKQQRAATTTAASNARLLARWPWPTLSDWTNSLATPRRKWTRRGLLSGWRSAPTSTTAVPSCRTSRKRPCRFQSSNPSRQILRVTASPHKLPVYIAVKQRCSGQFTYTYHISMYLCTRCPCLYPYHVFLTPAVFVTLLWRAFLLQLSIKMTMTMRHLTLHV